MKNNYTLDYFQKAVLRNQYKILKLLYPFLDKSEGRYQQYKYEYYIDMLNLNLTTLYPELFNGGPELPREVQIEVLEIMELFDVMEASYYQLTADEKEKIDQAKVVFNGFSESDKYYEEIKGFFMALLRSEDFEDMPGLRVISEDMLGYPPAEPMMPIYKQMLGRYEVLKGRPGYNGQALSLHDLLYLTSNFDDPPAVSRLH
ncbi:YfbU family protein [Endozoicomonas sp. SM1973]|uniref:YfbU family protein n=1 Tax=Spartinivicinus marinus TaxID=2994442 RepID=A0A853ICD4_9GAMM|nr:YfbU family protein [Spartinivicinus marinus]NYZ69512.1 YfbU family protein [Spartinivicinus marinus]